MPFAEAMQEALTRLDTMQREVTEWEAEFLDSMLRRQRTGYAPSSKQRVRLAAMIRRYLHDQALAADVLGQERLFAYPQEEGIRR